MDKESDILPGTILWIAPFYNRSGFGVGARASVSALHKAGVRIRVLSVNQAEPGIDDCDLALIKSLETTPLIPPITAIFSHVPGKTWLDVKLPEPNLRIMDTTVFDCGTKGSTPPTEMLEVCREMDQIFLQSEIEREAFIAAGFQPEKVRCVPRPHHWMENPLIPKPTPYTLFQNKPFRFLCISLFLPRRRWDTLIEAYLEEFKDNKNVELYLKVSYPSWHAVPGKPRQDFHELVRSLRMKTGSQAIIIIDEELGKRTDIVKLIDSCDVYVSTDTAVTAPVSESRARHRLIIVPEGLLNIPIEYCISIPVNPDAKRALTHDDLLYQPNHKDVLYMPLLFVNDVRYAMRRAYDMPSDERRAKVVSASLDFPCPTTSVPVIISAIKAGWEYKALEGSKNAGKIPGRIAWEGSQFVHHSLALINRELCIQLLNSGYEISIIPFELNQFGADADTRFKEISSRINKPLTGKTDIHVRHHWPPNLTPPPEGHWVIIQPWEFGSLPEQWVQVFSAQVDEMWVPSKYVRQVYIESGVPAERVIVIPNGINPEKFHPDAKPYPLTTKKQFKFLFVGGTIYRKGIDLLLQAYLETFKGSDDVCLVIKDMGGNSFYAGQTFREEIERIRQAKGVPEIEYIEKILSEDEIVGLYTACNALVHPYRGEGFGLPILEAMACGIPVIVTNGGACLDFCNEKNSLLVQANKKISKEKRVGNRPTVGNLWFYEVDINDLKAKMRYAYEHPGEIRTLGKEISPDIRNNWTWEMSTNKIKERIECLRKVPVLRYTKDNSCSQTSGISGEMELLNKADALFQKGAYQESIDAYKRAIEYHPAFFDAYNNLGLVYASIDQPDEAISIFKKAIELNGKEASVFNNLGVLYYKKKMHGEARRCFEKALAIDAGYKEAQQNLEKATKLLS